MFYVPGPIKFQNFKMGKEPEISAAVSFFFL